MASEAAFVLEARVLLGLVLLAEVGAEHRAHKVVPAVSPTGVWGPTEKAGSKVGALAMVRLC